MPKSRINFPSAIKLRREGALERWKKALAQPDYQKKDYAKEQIRILEEKLKSSV